MSTADDIEIIELAGVKIPADPAVLTPPIIASMREGGYENARIKYLRKMVGEGDRIVDVGGGIGFTTTLMALQRRASLIVSIEGNPSLEAAAEQLHALNGVEVTRRTALVVTRNTGRAAQPFYVSRHYWGSSMLPGVKDEVAVVDVPVMTYGEVIAAYAPTMLVIDLEVLKEYLTPGASSGPLEAMELTGVDKVVVHLVQHFGGDAAIKRVFDFFSARGFVYDIGLSHAALVLFKRIVS